jgi:TetR/AcrR family transcriptional regulator, transcriptional repressor for nem operon
MMKLSKEQAGQNHVRIVNAAVRMFRQSGLDGVGVAELMSAAGFTHGGFYNHFESKDALAAEACACAFAEAAARFDQLRTDEVADATQVLVRYLEHYLSRSHRDDAAGGCPMPALAGDAARHPDAIQPSFARGLEVAIRQIEECLSVVDDSEPPARARAIILLSQIVGAVMLSRAAATSAPLLSEEILDVNRQNALKQATHATQTT